METSFNTVMRQVYHWVDTCRRETAIDPNPEYFELVMHPRTWHDVLRTVDVYSGPRILQEQSLNGFKVRLDLEIPERQVKLKCIWEVML